MTSKLKNSLIITTFSFFIYLNFADAALFQSKNPTLSSDYISNYLKASRSISHNKYSEANVFFSKAPALATSHDAYNFQYIFSLAMEGKLSEASKVISSLNNEYKENFLFQFIEGIYLIKNRNYSLAKKKFETSKDSNLLFLELNNYINLWLDAENTPSQEFNIKELKTSFANIKLIQSLLIYDYVGNDDLYSKTSAQILKQPKLGRYHFFHSIYLIKKNKIDEAEQIIKRQLLEDPNNLLMRQSYISLKEGNSSFFTKNYNSKDVNHGISELLYLFANVVQQQDQIDLSKLLVSLSNYLNPRFISNKLLNFENYSLQNENYYDEELSLSVASLGSEFYWYINFNKLLRDREKEKTQTFPEGLKKNLSESKYFKFSKLIDLANYYRSNKDYNIALDYYQWADKIASLNELDWKFYYYRGICNERLGNWDRADKDFLKSLEYSPKEYVVINYLAYSWLERGVNLDRSKKMLKDAVELSKWKLGYIIDSLGWAYYLSNDFDEAEKLLQIAYEQTPYEAEVYDHYGDVLWKNNKKIQARYIWRNATKLPSIDKERADRLNSKLLNGIN
jgi:tetratricopeptide (TPR) repeat protein